MRSVRTSGGGAKRAAFTLLEMVLVLAILTILAAVAVRSMESVDQQTRFEATQRTMDSVRRAVFGATRDADGSLLVSGFVADLGRLPQAKGPPPAGSGPEPADLPQRLQELWVIPENVLPFAIREAISDNEVLVACGWRGDYLQLGVGQTALKDGWGRAFDLLQQDGTAFVPEGGPVPVIRSRGADGLVDSATPSGYDSDIVLSIAGNGISATVIGNVFRNDLSTLPNESDGDVTVRFFGPDPSSGKVLEQSLTISPPFTKSFSFAGTAGPRVLRAYQGPGNPPPLRSLPTRVTLVPGDLRSVNLILR